MSVLYNLAANHDDQMYCDAEVQAHWTPIVQSVFYKYMKKVLKRLKQFKKPIIRVSEMLYEKGLVIKETIDFTVKSSLYIYAGFWILILMWFVHSNRIKEEELVLNIKLILKESEYLIPVSTFGVLLFVFTVLIPFFPNLIKSKTGRVFLFSCILMLSLFTLVKVVITLS